MSIPENPETIVILNNYYPTGLKEGQIWDHYQKYKNEIIKEIDNRPVILFIFIDVNHPIIRRKFQGSTFTLNKRNFDQIITGRTVSISVEQGDMVNYWCIDIDPGPTTTERQLKNCVQDLLNSSISKLQNISKSRVISTANSYHVYFYLKKKMNVDISRTLVTKMLSMEFSDKYLINKKKPKEDDINLDLTPIVFRGSHTVPYALTRNGLMCMDVTKNWKSFDRRLGIINENIRRIY